MGLFNLIFEIFDYICVLDFEAVWSETNENLNSNYVKTLVPPPDPSHLNNQLKYDNTEHTVRLPHDNSLCPICGKKRTNPCISRGGVCYCYRCIINYLREKKEKNPLDITRCPVTKAPLTENMIRRLYV